jgi:hypothetical protein
VIPAAIVASATPGVVAHRRSRFRVACSASIDDVAGVTVLSLSTRIKDPLPDRRSALVGRLPSRAASMNRRFQAWHTTVIPCTAPLAYAGHRAFSLLHGRLLDERLRFTVQVPHLGHRGSGHGPSNSRAGASWVIDIEDGVDALSGLLAQLARAFAACGGLSSNGGTKQSHRAVLFCELSLALSPLSQLHIDVSAPRRGGGRSTWP